MEIAASVHQYFWKWWRYKIKNFFNRKALQKTPRKIYLSN